MSEWGLPKHVAGLPEAWQDIRDLDNSKRAQVLKAIQKVAKKPLEKPAGYGVPLHGMLSGFCKIKLLKAGIRIVYKPVRTIDGMFLVVVAMRRDDEVYKIAEKRIKAHPEFFD